MQPRDLINYIENPGLLDSKSVAELQKLVNEFPYFQPAHLLLSLASKKWDASVYQQSLKKTAIVVTNRSHLFNLIHQLGDFQESTGHAPPAEPLSEAVVSQIKPEETKAESKHELDILKATEISTVAASSISEAEAEEELEKEVAKQVVVAFVEKEILKTPKANEPPIKETQPENFGDWLLYLKKNNGQPYPDIEKEVNESKGDKKQESLELERKARKEKNKALIDKIIENSPGHIKVKEDQKFFTPDSRAKESLLENEHLVTETLAKIYALQGNINKAIRAYEILSLKFPQKSAYFAGLIQKLKNN